MNTGKTVFAQLQEHLPLHQFRQCVKCNDGTHKGQSFPCLDQYLSLYSLVHLSKSSLPTESLILIFKPG